MMDEQACSGQSVCIKGSQLANAVLQCQLERHGESCVSRKNLRDFSPSRVSDMHLFALEFVLLLVLLTALLLLRVSTRRRRFDPDKFREAADKLAPAFREAEERLWATINGNPDNGRLGHWEVEGIRHRELPIFAVQYHAEASPGPLDNTYLFKQFVEMMEGKNK